jgi:hypothetical protein
MKNKIIGFLAVILLVSLFPVSCTNTQRDEAKQYALQIVKEVGKEAGIAAASVATDLSKLKLAEAERKLNDKIATAGAKNPDTAVDVAKLRLQLLGVNQAQKALLKAEEELEKLKSVDELPTPEPEPVLPAVVITPK